VLEKCGKKNNASYGRISSIFPILGFLHYSEESLQKVKEKKNTCEKKRDIFINLRVEKKATKLILTIT